MRDMTGKPTVIDRAANDPQGEDVADSFIARNESWLKALVALMIVAAVPVVSRALFDDHSSPIPEWLTALAATLGAVALGLSIDRTETASAKGLQYVAFLGVCALGLFGYGSLLISLFTR